MDMFVAEEEISQPSEVPLLPDAVKPTTTKTTITVKADGAIIYTDYNDIKHEILATSIFVTRLRDGLIDYLSTRDRKQRRGRKPREVVPEEEEVKYSKPGPLSRKPAFFSPAFSKLKKKAGKKSAPNMSTPSSHTPSMLIDRGSGKRKRKAPSWMMHDDFLVDHETVEATRIMAPVTSPRKMIKMEAEDDDPVVSKASLLHPDKMGEDEEEAEELAAAGKKDVLGFKNWVSSQSSKDAVLDESILGNRIVDKDQSPPRHLKEKIIKPFACGVCQMAFAEALELQEHIREKHEVTSPVRRRPLTEKRKSYLDEDTQTVKCDKCQGWFSARGIERHKTMAHGGRLSESGEVSGSGAEKVEVSSTTPESGRVAGATGQCHLCNFRAVTADQLAKHLKYTHKVEADSHKAPSGKGEEVVAAGGAGAGEAGVDASSQPVIDIRPDGNKIYIDTHGLNLQPEDAARICAEVMTIPDNAEIIILK